MPGATAPGANPADKGAVKRRPLLRALAAVLGSANRPAMQPTFCRLLVGHWHGHDESFVVIADAG